MEDYGQQSFIEELFSAEKNYQIKAGGKPAPVLSLYDLEITKTMLKITTFFQGEEIEVWDVDENWKRVDRVDVVVKIEEVLDLGMGLFDGYPTDGDKSA